MINNKKALLNLSIVLFLLEAFLFFAISRGEFFKYRQVSGVGVVISFIPAIIRGGAFSVLFIAAFIYLTNWNNLKSNILKSIIANDVLVQVIIYFFLLGYLVLLIEFHISGWPSVLFFLLFILTWIIFIFASVNIFINKINFIHIIQNFWYILLVAAALIFFDQISVVYNLEIEGYFHSLLFDPTVAVSKYLLELIGYQVVVDENLFKISLNNFSGEIAAVCLGYQGAILGFLFLAGYLYALRKDFRFPHVLIVLPLTVLVLWLLNSVRIALLLAIGSSWSEEIAVNGFHRVGGWINLIGVSSLMLYVLHRTPWLSSLNRTSIVNFSINKENISLLPQLTLIGSTLLSLLFTGQFDWLYPVRVLIVGFILVYTCRQTNFKFLKPDFITVFLGLVVFIIWIVMVPGLSNENAEFSNAIAKIPAMSFYVWVFFRIIGAVLIVPLSEELAFRGFVVNRLNYQLSPSISLNFRHLIAGLTSSLAFGLLHDAWLSGIIAGLIFYYAMSRRSQISDAVVVHAITNLLISIYVLITHQWSYW